MSKVNRVPGYMQSKGTRSRGPLGDREIRYKCSMQNTILDVLRARPGWQEVAGPNTAPSQQQQGQKGSAPSSQQSKDKNGTANTPSGATTTAKTSNQNATPSSTTSSGATTTTKASDGDWDFYWCDREWLHANYDTMFLQEHQKILHFRNHYELTRKNLMVKNLKRLRKQTEREMGKKEAETFDFYPTTYELPVCCW